MPYTVVSFQTRKPELSPAEFEDYHDNVHVHMIQEAIGSFFPKTHARHYLKRQSGDRDNLSSTLLFVFIGSVQNIDYDTILILTFDSEQHLFDFQTKYEEPETAAKVGDSAEKFIICEPVVGRNSKPGPNRRVVQGGL